MTDEEKEELEKKKIKEEMDKARNNVLAEANEERKLKKAESAEKDSSVVITETSKTAMKAIQKETNLEELIKQEAEEKNKIEEMKLRKQIELEKKKQNCVAKANARHHD